MENRERDRVSQRTSPTDAGELNRSVEEEKGRRQHSGTTAEFGQNIGESENLNDKGERMHNRNKNDDMSNSDMSKSNVGRDRESSVDRDREPSRRSGQGSYGSSSGRRSGSSNEIGSDRSSDISSDVESGSTRRDSSGELGSRDRSEGRH